MTANQEQNIGFNYQRMIDIWLDTAYAADLIIKMIEGGEYKDVDAIVRKLRVAATELNAVYSTSRRG